MGQYYRVFTKQGRKETVYNRYLIVNGKKEYTMAKLMEHSWWENPFVLSICNELYKNKQVIAWIGDYANTWLEKGYTIPNNITRQQYRRICKKTWHCEKDNGIAIMQVDFELKGKSIVNHDTKEYIDLSQYFEEAVTEDGWCIHPLPLLTCVGNGLGGGDYYSPTDDSDENMVGSWAFCTISIEDAPPSEYSQTQPIFKENY